MPSEAKRIVWSLAVITLLGCSKETKPVAEDAKAPTAESAESDAKPGHAQAPENGEDDSAKREAKAEAAAMAGTDSVSETSFDLKMQPSGSYQVGKTASVEIVLDAKQPYKVNQDYPYSFSLKETQGVSFPAMKVKKDAVKLEEKHATMKVDFTPESAGERTIAGTFKFSVCTDEQCLIKKQELALAVTVQ